MPLEPIAIIGIGCRYPGAQSPDAFWQLLRDGIDAIEEVPPSRWEVDRFYDSDRSQPNKTNTRWGGFLPEIDRFDPQFFGIAPREVNSMDPQQRLLLEVAWEALEDGGQIPEQLRGSQTGVFIGIGTHDYSIMLWQDPVNDPYATTGTGNCIAANRISYVFDFKGPSLAIDTACSSSLVAVHLACQSLWCGESTLALAGGVNVLLLPTVTIGFSKGGFMSSMGRCKSFDASADGYVRSEGAGVVVLKPVSQALQDGDSIYAVIRGSAVNQDGFSNGMAAPNPIAQVAVLREAYRNAGVSPGQVQYVEAHGTGTKLGDPIELKALGAVLSDGRAPNCPCAIGSVKTNIGHTETAAGVAGLIKVALSLKQGQIPPSLHFSAPNPQIDFATLPLRVQTELVPWKTQSTPALAGVNSFGFGGTNAHVVVEAAPVKESKRKQGTGNRHRGWHLLTLSAKNEAALREMAQRYVQFLQAHPDTTIGDLCFTANTKRSRFQHRLAVVTESVEQLQQQLGAFAARVEATGVFHHVTTGETPQVVFLFTGQGSQYVDMGRQLYETEPVFRQALERCDAILQSELDRSLLSVLYPDLNSVTKEDRKKKSKKKRGNSEFVTDVANALNQTIYTQPALFAIEYALVQLWQSWGITPAAVIGHSVGEYVAACVAGVFSLKDGLKLIAARGRLMQALPQNGAMLSVLADETTVRSHLANHSTVSIAALNGFHSTVISGHHEAITAIEQTLQTHGIKTTRLNVSHAFHSPLMEPILAEFAKVAAKVNYNAPKLPMVSNVTGQFIADDIATPDYWCQHICQPVQFSCGINTLHQQNYQIFLEIGAKPTLLGLARGCLPQPEKVWLPSLRPGQSDEQTLLQSLGILYGHGAPIDWNQLTNNTIHQIISIPTYPFQRQRYWWDEAILPGMRNRSQSNDKLTSSIHPLLGERLLLAGSSELRFQVQVSAQHPTYLRDHCVLGQPVFPAAAYIEMVLAAGQQVMKTEQLIIERLTIEKPLLLHSSTFTTIQILLAPEGTRYSFKIFSFNADLNQADTATCHATGTVVTYEKQSKSTVHFTDLRTSVSNSAVDRDSYYQQLRNQGLHYGEKFQGIIQLWHKAGQVFSQIQLPDTQTDTDCYYLHPVILDACFQTIAAILPAIDRGTYLPTGIDRLQVYRPAGKSAWSHVTLEPAMNGSHAGCLKANLQLFDEVGAIVAEIEGLTLQFVASASLQQLVGSNPLQPNAAFEQWFYQIEWQPQPLLDRQTNQDRDGFRTPQYWLIFSDRQGIGTTLAEQLQAQGDRCVLVFAKSSDSASLPHRVAQSLTIDAIVIDPTKAIEFQQLFTNLSNLSATTADSYGVIHLWSLDSESCETSCDDGLLALQTTQELGCGSILHLIQAWGQTKSVRLSRLWLITQETQSVTAEPLMVTTPRQSIQQASIWGLGRVIQLEHPELNCICVDIDAFYNQHQVSSLVDLILQEIYHCYSQTVISTTQIAYRKHNRYVAQLVPFDRKCSTRNTLQIPDASAFRLGMSDDGVLDNLALISTDRRLPQPGEIEIQVGAAGVNFRDVLNALGMLKPYLEQMGVANASEIPFGGECAGRVVAVGAGVTDFQIGDEVIAAPAIGSLGQFITVDARFVARKPRTLSLLAAATIPTTFLTAYYGLCRLAKLRRGDRVLIHAAAGGVGQAAVQLAKSVGAEIYATASPSKWEFLQSIGITHLFNSRDLEFADQILHLTQGHGVDVVLNSLNGDFIAQSLAILAPKGRFVEIGKIGIWSAEQVRQARSDVVYFPFDLLEVARQTPTVIADLLQALMPLFEQGLLHPLPHTVFPIESAPAAFRYMAQAKHIGKVVLTVPPPTSAWIVRSEGSYLITGGLGALGLQVAQWLVRQGATHLILASRRSPSASAMQTIQQLEQSGANIVIAQADISQREEVDRLLTSTVPPIRGIIHAAGVLDDGVLQQLSWQRFEQVLAPKVTGTWNLHQASQNLSLDFFVCFSSIASLLGSPGQGSYAAANAFMDALMHYRRRIGLPGLSINWGPWAESGMAAELTDRYQSRLSSQGLKRIEPQQGLQVLETLLRQRHAQVGVLPVDWAIFLEANPMASSTFLSALASTTHISSTASTTQLRSELLQQLEKVELSDRLPLLQDHLRMQLSKVLGFSSPDLIDPQENFADLGMDSLMAVEFNNRLQTSLNCTIPQSLTFDYPTVESLANHLLKTTLTIPITIAESNLSPSDSLVDTQQSNLLNQDQSNNPNNPSSQSQDAEFKSGQLPNSTQPNHAQSLLELTELELTLQNEESQSINKAIHSISQKPNDKLSTATLASALPLPLHSIQLSHIPKAYYQFDQSIEYQNLQKDLDRLRELGNPFFVVQQGTARDTTCIDDQTLINYSSYNYLGMSGDPIVIQAVKAAIDRYGTSVSASRVVSGERPIHQELEQEIASFLGTEDCIAYVGGHSTNVTTIGHLLGERDLILCDALSHNSIRQGCALSGATVMNFPHNDWRSLEQILSQHRHHYEKTLIAIEGIYSTDGDIAPLPEIVSLKHHYKSLLLVDEAHSIGVLGNQGRGVAEHFQIDSTHIDLWMGTLSKSFASCGGYIAASQAIVTYLKYTAPGFVFSVGMSPANAAAALASIRVLKQEPERVRQLHDRANLFLTLAKQHNLNTGASHNSPIIPVIVGEPHKAVQLSHRLQTQGIHVQPMVYPSVPYYAARLRFFVSCLHSEEQIHETIDRVADAIHWVESNR